MKPALALLGSGIFTSSLATSPIEIQWLTPANASALGFEVETTLEEEFIRATLTGPLDLNVGCEPKRSGTALLDADGNELLVYIADFEQSDTRPMASGYFGNADHTMEMWIDYICPAGRSLESRRYSVKSIVEFLSE